MFGAILGLILLIVATAVAYFLLIRWARDNVQKAARQLSAELRSFEGGYRQFLSGMSAYSPDDPEPYGAPARALRESSDQIGERLYSLRERYVQIQQRLPRKPGNALQMMAVSPLLLNELRRLIQGMRTELAGAQATLTTAVGELQDLDGLGWRTAGSARQARANLTLVQQRLGRIRERHAHGTSFDNLVQGVEGAAVRLGQIPEYFVTADQDAFQAQATKPAVIQTQSIVAQTTPILADAAAKLSEWETRLAAADDKFTRLRQAYSALEQSLATLPAAVDAAVLAEGLKGIQAEGQRLQAQFSRPELEKLPALGAALDAQIQTAGDLNAAAGHARQAQTALESELHALAEGQKQISDLYTRLGTAKSFRLVWSKTSQAVSGLSQGLSDLGTADRSRPPEKLDSDLEKAAKLALAQEELWGYLQQVDRQHTELVGLLEDPELSQALLWTQNSAKLLQQIGGYHPDNWPRADAVGSLPNDLRALGDGLQRLGAARPDEGVAESQLTQRVDEARRLGASYQALHSRLSVVEARLSDLQQNETQAQELLENTRSYLAQAAYIVNSNPGLAKTAAAEIERLQKQIEKQLAELEQRGQGTVDSKTRQAKGIVARSEQALSEWLNQLNLEVQAKTKALTASLTRLDSIAALDDAPVSEARRLLSAAPGYGGVNTVKQGYPLDFLVMELKRRSEAEQSCTAVALALADLEKPVVESYNTASQKRSQVQDQFTAANTWQRQTRAWPPVTVDVDAEYRALGRLEAEWGALKEKSLKAIDLVKRLGDLAREYQDLSTRMGQLIERGEREQKDVLKLESELDDYLSKWEKLGDAYPDNPEASDDIHQLLDEADQEMYRLKTQYREGALNYTQVSQALQALHRKVRLYQAVLDDAHVIDVSGRVIASRESKRAPGEW